MFAFLYKVIPNTKVRPRSALTAGIIAGTIFQIFQIVYVYIQSSLTSYNAIYGSFAAFSALPDLAANQLANRTFRWRIIVRLPEY